MTINLPPNWQTKSLGEICPPECLEKLKPVLTKERPSSEDFLEVLKPYREELEDNGVLPEYLAYYLEAAVQSGMI